MDLVDKFNFYPRSLGWMVKKVYFQSNLKKSKFMAKMLKTVTVYSI